MDLRKLKKLIDLVQESGIGEITIEEAGMRVSVRSSSDLPPAPASTSPLAIPEPEATPALRPSNGLVAVESPMVGVFYRAPEPGAPAYVEIGDTVVNGQTLCVLEAMKLFNELKSEASGIVRSVLAENGQPVEFGQVLFELEPVSGIAPLDAV